MFCLFEFKKSDAYEEEISNLNKTLVKSKLDYENMKFDYNKVLEKNEGLVESLKRNSIEMNDKW